MTIKERIKVNAIIGAIAIREGTTPAQVRSAIREAIDEAWNNKTTDSSAAWIRYFPDGTKPSTEEFIVTLAGKLSCPEP